MNLTVSNKTNTLQALFYKGYRALAHGTPHPNRFLMSNLTLSSLI